MFLDTYGIVEFWRTFSACVALNLSNTAFSWACGQRAMKALIELELHPGKKKCMLHVLHLLKDFANTSPNPAKKSKDDSPAAEHHPPEGLTTGCDSGSKSWMLPNGTSAGSRWGHLKQRTKHQMRHRIGSHVLELTAQMLNLITLRLPSQIRHCLSFFVACLCATYRSLTIPVFEVIKNILRSLVGCRCWIFIGWCYCRSHFLVSACVWRHNIHYIHTFPNIKRNSSSHSGRKEHLWK